MWGGRGGSYYEFLFHAVEIPLKHVCAELKSQNSNNSVSERISAARSFTFVFLKVHFNAYRTAMSRPREILSHVTLLARCLFCVILSIGVWRNIVLLMMAISVGTRNQNVMFWFSFSP